MAVSKWVVKGSVRDCEIDEKAVEKVRELVEKGRRGIWYAYGWPALLYAVDGDDRSGVDSSNEPFYIYDGQSLEEAVSQAKEWLAGEDVTVYAGGAPALERVAYSFAEIGWVEDDDSEDYESDYEIVGAATGDNLPGEYEKAWRRALRDYQGWCDYENEDFGSFKYFLELAGGSLDG